MFWTAVQSANRHSDIHTFLFKCTCFALWTQPLIKGRMCLTNCETVRWPRNVGILYYIHVNSQSSWFLKFIDNNTQIDKHILLLADRNAVSVQGSSSGFNSVLRVPVGVIMVTTGCTSESSVMQFGITDVYVTVNWSWIVQMCVVIVQVQV